MSKEFRPVHARHAEIGNNGIEPALLASSQGGLSVPDKFEFPAFFDGTQHAPHPIQDIRFIVDEQDAFHAAPGLGGCSGVRDFEKFYQVTLPAGGS
jgi:hypothetical protein